MSSFLKDPTSDRETGVRYSSKTPSALNRVESAASEADDSVSASRSASSINFTEVMDGRKSVEPQPPTGAPAVTKASSSLSSIRSEGGKEVSSGDHVAQAMQRSFSYTTYARNEKEAKLIEAVCEPETQFMFMRPDARRIHSLQKWSEAEWVVKLRVPKGTTTSTFLEKLLERPAVGDAPEDGPIELGEATRSAKLVVRKLAQPLSQELWELVIAYQSQV